MQDRELKIPKSGFIFHASVALDRVQTGYPLVLKYISALRSADEVRRMRIVVSMKENVFKGTSTACSTP